MIGEHTKRRAMERVGCRVGDYTLEMLLGVGGMAAVYAARDERGSRVAIKLLHEELARVQEIRVRFAEEAKIANAIDHAGVVRVLGHDVDGEGRAFLVMELLEGETLEEDWRRRRKPISERRVVARMLSLLDVLAAAHERGIVHRDVKPANVFLGTDGTLRLMDFGIARMRESAAATRSGVPMGTPAFMAPEQAGGRTKEVDARTDLWAVGAIMFLLLTGQEVHSARNAQEQLIYAATQTARSLGTLAPGASAQLIRAVDVALAFERERRWPSARAMAAALSVETT